MLKSLQKVVDLTKIPLFLKAFFDTLYTLPKKNKKNYKKYSKTY